MATNFRLPTSLLLAALLTAALTGCASQSPQRTGEAAHAGNAQPLKQKKPSGGAGTSTGCDAASLHLYQPGKGKIDGDELAVYTDRSKTTKSLCDVLDESGKSVAIFQFAGVFCISCQEEATELTQALKESKYGKDIVHVVVLTDFFADYTDDLFKGFMDQYAPDSVAVYDEAKLWKYFSADSSLPNRATIMAMDRQMNAVVYNEEGKQGQIMSAAEKLAKALKESTP